MRVGAGCASHHLAHRDDFEESSGHTFTNEDIAFRQALGSTDKRAKKLPSRFGFVAPDNDVRGGLHFEYTGAGAGGGGIPAVIKQKYVAVGKKMRVVLVPQLLAAPLPGKGTAVPVNDRHDIEETKVGEHVTIGQYFAGVGVRPLMPLVEGTALVGLYIQVLIAVPFPDDALSW